MAITLTLKVVPSAGKQHLEQTPTGIIKCYLKSSPEKGKANLELIKLLSKKLSIPQAFVHIVKGATSRNKIVLIEADISKNDILQTLGLDIQTTI